MRERSPARPWRRRASRFALPPPVVLLVAALALTLTARAEEDSSDVPAAPSGLTATMTYDAVSLSWDDPGNDSITGYQVLRWQRGVHQRGDFQVHVADTGSAANSYVDTAVEADASYVYRIQARNSNGLSERSSFFNADLPADPDPEQADLLERGQRSVLRADEMLVSNTAETTSGSHTLAHPDMMGSSFTTGAVTEGYAISSVTVEWNSVPSDLNVDHVRVRIAVADSTNIHNDVYTFNNPASIVAGANTFASDGNLTLAAGTDYCIYVRAAGGAVGDISITTSASATLATGWTVTKGRTSGTRASSTNHPSDTLKFAITGSARTTAEPATQTASFGVGESFVDEGAVARILVELSQNAGSALSIGVIAIPLGDASLIDYTLGDNGATSISSTEKSGSLSVTAENDALYEGREAIRLEFRDLPDGVSAGHIDSTVLFINDDDDPYSTTLVSNESRLTTSASVSVWQSTAHGNRFRVGDSDAPFTITSVRLNIEGFNTSLPHEVTLREGGRGATPAPRWRPSSIQAAGSRVGTPTPLPPAPSSNPTPPTRSWFRAAGLQAAASSRSGRHRTWARIWAAGTAGTS